MKIAFLFAGQGAQSVGMGKDFYDAFDSVKKIYDEFPSIRDLCFVDQEGVINQTAYAQKAMLLTSYAIATVLKEKGIEPQYTCGLSLGEYTALTFAETWPLKDAIEIISHRGNLMQNALPLGTTKMAAIIGSSREVIQECLSQVTSGVVEIANYNCPGQIVITGENKAVDDALVLLKEKARRCLPLNVSGAFHCSLLNEASVELRKVLDQFVPQKPKYTMLYNVSGKEEERELNDILQEQICHSVYFEDTIQNLFDKGVDTFIEIGPGKTLSGFVRKTLTAPVKIYNVSDVASLDLTLAGLKEDYGC